VREERRERESEKEEKKIEISRVIFFNSFLFLLNYYLLALDHPFLLFI